MATILRGVGFVPAFISDTYRRSAGRGARAVAADDAELLRRTSSSARRSLRASEGRRGMSERRELNYFTSIRTSCASTPRPGCCAAAAGRGSSSVSEDFLRGFVAACEHETGPAATLVLRRCGEFFGARLARRFEAELGQYAGVSLRDRQMAEFDELVRDLWRGCGLGDSRSTGPAASTGSWRCADRQPDAGHRAERARRRRHVLWDPGGFFSGFCDAEMRSVQTGDLRLGDREGTTFIVAAFEVAKRVEGMRANRSRHSEILAALGT
jgi:hypothetical protein